MDMPFADGAAQGGMIEQPAMKPQGALGKRPQGDQQKNRGRHHRQDHAENREAEVEPAKRQQAEPRRGADDDVFFERRQGLLLHAARIGP